MRSLSFGIGLLAIIALGCGRGAQPDNTAAKGNSIQGEVDDRSAVKQAPDQEEVDRVWTILCASRLGGFQSSPMFIDRWPSARKEYATFTKRAPDEYQVTMVIHVFHFYLKNAAVEMSYLVSMKTAEVFALRGPEVIKL